MKHSPSSARNSADSYTVVRYKNSRHWAIHALDGKLVRVALYRKGAVEAARRLNGGKEGKR